MKNIFVVTDGNYGTVNIFKGTNTTNFSIENKSGSQINIGVGFFGLTTA